MRLGSSRARGIPIFRRTAWTRRPNAGARRSTSVIVSRRASRIRCPSGRITSWRSAAGSRRCCRAGNCRESATAQSGRPFTVALLPDIDNSNTGRSNLGFGNNDRPNVSGDPTLSEPDAGHVVQHGRLHDSAVRIVRRREAQQPRRTGVRQPECRARPARPVRRDGQLQLRLEAFNVFDRANFNLPDAFLGSPTFGKILSAGSPRRLQFGVRALF